jgi:hypothetical protein
VGVNPIRVQGKQGFRQSMRYRYENRIGCEDRGLRVTVRYRTSDGMASDVVGFLEVCNEASFGIRNRSDELVVVDRATVIASKVVGATGPQRAPRND